MHSDSTGRMNWDDLRFVLAVAEAGSVSAAARRLGVNHATVLRRIAAFEEAAGTTLFDRTAQGYAILPDRLRVIEAAREAGAAMEAVGRLLRGAEAQISGTVRVTSTDSLCQSVLPCIVASLSARAAGLRIDLLSTNAHLDLARLGADISIRPALRLPDDLVGEQAGQMGFAVYGAAGPVRTERWLSLRGMLARAPIAALLEREVAEDDFSGGSDSFVILREMAAAGLGRAVLPLCLGEDDARLSRRAVAFDLPPVPLWVASHADLAEAPRLRTVRRKLAQALLAEAPRLAGAPL